MKRDSLHTMLGSAMGLRLAMAALNYGLFWLLSHRFSTEALGGFSLLMNIFLMVQLLPLLGLSTPLIRRVASEREQIASEMTNALVIALPMAVVIALLIFGVGHWTYPAELRLPFALLAAAVLPGAWILVAESTLLGMERMVVIARVQLGEVAARVVGAVLVVELGYGLVGVFAMVLLLRLLVAGVYAWLPLLPALRPGLLSAALWRRNRAEIPVFLGIALLASLTTRLDVIVLSRMQGLQDVGIYAAAARLYDAALMLPTVAALAMMPTLARLFVSDSVRFGELLVLALRASLSVGMLLALAVAALAQPLISLLYVPAVAPAAAVLQWLIFAAVLMAADQILSSTMLAAKAQADDMKALARGAVILLVCLLLLTWLIGARGAAISVVVAQLCRVSLRIQWAVRALNLPGLGSEWRLQLAAGAAGVCGLLLGLSWPGSGPVSWLSGWLLAWLAWFVVARCCGIIGASWLQQVASLMGRARDRFVRRAGR